jgi:hypothetical protein
VIEGRLLASLRRSARSLAAPVAAVGATSASALWLYLWPFIRDRRLAPFGMDPIGYIWRTNVVHDLGIAALTPAVTGQAKTLGSRPLYLTLVSALEALTGRSSFDLAWIMPGILATTVGLSAGVLVVDGMRLSRWWAIPIGVGVATSPFTALTATYSTNLTADALLLAAAALSVRATWDRRQPRAGIALLLGAALLAHWMFGALALGLVLAYAIAIAGIGRRGDGCAVGRSIAFGSAGAVVLAVAGFLLAPQVPGALPQVTAANAAIISRWRLPLLSLGVTIVLAAVALAILLLLRRREIDAGALFLLLWTTILPAGLIAWYVLDIPFPPYRVAAFVLALPILAVLLGPALAARFEHAGEVARVGGSLVAIGIAAWLALGGTTAWLIRRQAPVVRATVYDELSTSAAYVSALPPHTDLVFVTDRAIGLGFVQYVIASGLPADRLADVRVVSTSQGQLPPIPSGSAVLYLRSNNADTPAGEARQLGPGVFVIQGPDVAVRAGGADPFRVPHALTLVMSSLACLLILTIAGSGWSLALSDAAWGGRVALAPALGIASIGIVALVLSRLGVPFMGGGAWLMLVVSCGTGWLLWAARDRSRPNALRTNRWPSPR